MGSTALLDLPYPEETATADPPRDIKALAEKVDVLGRVPIGAMMMWPFAGAPPNLWLLVDGGSYAIASYPTLGAMYGENPAGSGNFKLPNFQQRFPIGPGAGRQVGDVGGAETAALTSPGQLPAHKHTVNDPGHVHNDSFAVANAAAINTGGRSAAHTHSYLKQSAAGANVPGGTGVAVARAGLYDTVGGGTESADHHHTLPIHGHGLNGGVLSGQTGITLADTGAGDPFPNMPPFVVVNFIIRAK